MEREEEWGREEGGGNEKHGKSPPYRLVPVPVVLAFMPTSPTSPASPPALPTLFFLLFSHLLPGLLLVLIAVRPLGLPLGSKSIHTLDPQLRCVYVL